MQQVLPYAAVVASMITPERPNFFKIIPIGFTAQQNYVLSAVRSGTHVASSGADKNIILLLLFHTRNRR